MALFATYAAQSASQKKLLLKLQVGGGRKAMTDKKLRNKVVDRKIPFARIPIKGSR